MARADMLLYDKQGSPVAIVEVKAQENVDDETLRFYLQELKAQAAEIRTEYVILVLPERLQVWHLSNGREDLAAELDFAKVLKKHLPKAQRHAKEPGAHLLEMLVYSWLDSLTTASSTDLSEEEKKLESTGLLEKIREGSLHYQFA